MKLGVCLLLTLVAAGCGARTAGPLDVSPRPDAQAFFASGSDAGVETSLSEFITRARALALEARPPERLPIRHAETADPALAAALVAARVHPSPETLRHVAEAYRRLGIADRAHQYLQQALRMDARDAATYDAMARLWRDGGLPSLALADAYRAVYYAPSSAVAHNTLGTVFQALGRRADARRQYQHALALDATAAYALNNLCYSWLLEADAGRAVTACLDALQIDPGLAAARNNLALAHAVRGDVNAARVAFEAVGDRATAAYNIGIVHMARRQYTDAVSAFAAAQQARPSLHIAAARAEQAGRLDRTGAGE